MQIRQIAKIAIHLQDLKFERIILVVESTTTKGLNQLIDRITNGKIEKVVILYKSEDLIQIVTICRYLLQGNRANKAKKMIKELMEDDTS